MRNRATMSKRFTAATVYSGEFNLYRVGAIAQTVQCRMHSWLDLLKLLYGVNDLSPA